MTNDYTRARYKSFLHRVWAAMRGESTALLPYDAVKAKLHVGGPIYRGMRTVPVAQIVGSVGRYRDFDNAFLPTQGRTQERWKSIGRAFYQDVSLPPIKLYKVGDAYFVLDGNHRVSVAREQNQVYIDAEVLEGQVRVPIGADLQLEDLEILGERVTFLERTRLDQLRPDADIRFTIAGGYERLLEHIAVHRYYMGAEAQHEILEDEAVTHWYENVYLPVVEVVREHGVLAEFPGRTEADLYLWIIDHRHYLRESFGEDTVSTESAAEDYAQQFSERPVARVTKVARQVVHHLLAPVTGHADKGEDPGEGQGPARDAAEDATGDQAGGET